MKILLINYIRQIVVAIILKFQNKKAKALFKITIKIIIKISASEEVITEVIGNLIVIKVTNIKVINSFDTFLGISDLSKKTIIGIRINNRYAQEMLDAQIRK